MTFKLHIPGREDVAPAAAANRANPLTDAASAADQQKAATGAISGLAGLAALADCEYKREAFEERAAIMEFDGGLSRTEAEVAALRCVDCEHLGRHRTCLEPVAAGLLTSAEGFGIAWPPAGYGGDCEAFAVKAPAQDAGEPE